MLEARDIKLEYERPYLYPKQFAAIFDERRYSLIEASTKAGKTAGCIVWIVEEALKGSAGWNYWWVAPVSGQADIAFRRCMRALPEWMYTHNLTAKTITLVNGAIIVFKSGDKPDSLYGEDVYAAVVDEASRLKADAWYAVRSTLTATRGPVRIIGNVKGRKNWFYQMARRAEQGDPVMGYHKIVANDAVDAGVLDAEEIEDARRQLPENVFNELYLAEASDDGGNPFGIGHIRNCIDAGGLAPYAPSVWGWDLAKKVDWTVGIALDREARVCWLERFQHWPWDVTIDRIHELSRSKPTLVDSTGVGDPIVDLLQKKSGGKYEGYQFSSPSKQKLMEGLAVAIQSGAVSYPDGPIVLELEEFGFEYTRTGVRYCVDPETPILTDDLRWVTAGTLKVGDGLTAFDEFPGQGEKTRCWRRASVVAAGEIVRPCYRVSLADGASVTVSAEHLWLVETAGKLEWRKTEDLKAEHPSSKSNRHAPTQLIKLLDTWEMPNSYESGYLAAAFDGEGSISQNSRRDHKGTSARLTFAQRENAMARTIREFLRYFSFEWSESSGRSCINFGLTGRRHELLRFLGQIRPKRLMDKFDPERLGTLEKKGLVAVRSVEFLGDMTVVALGTSTKTFVAAGFASHNSAPEGFNDDCVMALALAVHHQNHAPMPLVIPAGMVDKIRTLSTGRRPRL